MTISANYRAASAENEIRKTAEETRKQIAKLGSNQTLLEAALKVLMKHKLLEEFAHEHCKIEDAPLANGKEADRPALPAPEETR